MPREGKERSKPGAKPPVEQSAFPRFSSTAREGMQPPQIALKSRQGLEAVWKRGTLQ